MVAAFPIEPLDMITSDPAIRNGRPILRGTTLRVTDIVVASLSRSRTPDEIAEDYNLTLAQVYGALAFYYDHKAELDIDIREQIASARNAKEKRLGSRHSPLLG